MFFLQLSNVQIKENSGADAVVGNLATSDEDIRQNHTYRLLDSAGGRFKVDGSLVKVILFDCCDLKISSKMGCLKKCTLTLACHCALITGAKLPR